jgi:hypothetical protein
MELILLKQDSPAWNYAWDWIANHPINEGLDNPSLAINKDEAWQYMGSFKEGDRVVSEFRHRCHPYNDSIQKLSVSHQFVDKDDILKKFRL